MTVRWLSRSWGKATNDSPQSAPRTIVCTGERMEEVVTKLYRPQGVKTTTFEPNHAKGLSNEFRCYANYECDDWTWRQWGLVDSTGLKCKLILPSLYWYAIYSVTDEMAFCMLKGHKLPLICSKNWFLKYLNSTIIYIHHSARWFKNLFTSHSQSCLEINDKFNKPFAVLILLSWKQEGVRIVSVIAPCIINVWRDMKCLAIKINMWPINKSECFSIQHCL